MNKLCIKLPPLAPDYSGVCSALYEFEGMSIIHDASGCTGNYTGYDEPRWYENQRLVFCSGLREIDAILGNDEKLVNKVKKAAEDLKPKFIAVLGSPVPMIIGSDLIGIAKEIENETKIPTIGFNTKGLQYYDRGIQKAYMEIAKRFLKEKKETINKSVNLLGATPLDFSINANVQDLKQFFISNGYSINACWSMGCSFEEIKNTTKAEINVVVSVSGLELARYLKKKFDMPYIVGLPVGETGEMKLLNLLKGNQPMKFFNMHTNKQKVLIIGEQVLSNSLRELLQQEYNQETIDVATFFMLDKEIAQKNDIFIENEMHLIKLLGQQKYTTIIGDPLIKGLLSNDNVKYIELPHVAVSSKICFNKNSEVISNKVYRLFKEEEEII
ncbi:nitrogenase component 1 [Tissierella praeacuta]|uniref:nitrogenase component 1 n=1 Tax=Tissierella praeacuta TaxID=43131 RepID=UPI002FD8CDFC